ncbi:MAG: DUF4166 domain-containing protein [Telluria sp.]
MTTSSDSVFRQVLGPDFNLLAAELQRFHSLAGRFELTGKLTVKGPHSIAGRLVCAMFALPQTTTESNFRFELDAGAKQETWRRHFPGRLMVSKMRVGADVLVERFGPINFHFRLQADQGQLNMLLQSVTVFGIPSPRFLMPTMRAQETGAQGKLHFSVSAHLPLVGLLAEYRGYLDIEGEDLAA